MAWVGCYRLNGSAPWQKAVEADTVGECAAALTAFLKAHGLKPDNRDECLTAGKVPTVPPRRQGRKGGTLGTSWGHLNGEG
jgi:hypothetical protein